MKIDQRVFLPVIGVLFVKEDDPIIKEPDYIKYQERCFIVFIISIAFIFI